MPKKMTLATPEVVPASEEKVYADVKLQSMTVRTQPKQGRYAVEFALTPASVNPDGTWEPMPNKVMRKSIPDVTAAIAADPTSKMAQVFELLAEALAEQADANINVQ